MGGSEQLAGSGVALLACTIVDNAGLTRVKSVPARRIESIERTGIGLSDVFAVFAVNDEITKSPGFEGPSGDMRLIPDLASAVVLPDAPRWAWAPADQHDQDLEPMPTCQRTTLKRVAERAARHGLDLQMTYEVEFTLFGAGGQPLHRGPSYSPRAYLPLEELAVELVETLEGMGILVEQVHPEYSDGQYEISVGPKPPLAAADQQVLLRLTIMRIARRYGFDVSFAPVAIPDLVGNGCHLHYSLWREGRNLMSGGDRDEGLTGEACAFTAGILRHLPELMAVYAPSPTSYERLVPHHWAGAYTCWGRENREAALRFVRGTRGTEGRSANIELKVVDGAANPYVAAACLVGSGLAGLEAGAELPPPLTEDPADLSEDRAEELSVRRLPEGLEQATELFEGSSVAAEILGDPLHQAFAAVRRFEWGVYRDLAPEEAADHLRWRYG